MLLRHCLSTSASQRPHPLPTPLAHRTSLAAQSDLLDQTDRNNTRNFFAVHAVKKPKEKSIADNSKCSSVTGVTVHLFAVHTQNLMQQKMDRHELAFEMYCHSQMARTQN